MSEPILYLDQSTILDPDFAGLREAVADLTQFVREQEPQLLLYGFEIDERTSTMRVAAVHPDSASLELHLGIGGPGFRRVGAFIDLQRIDVFGRPSPDVIERLHEKAAALGTDAHVEVHGFASVFERLSTLLP